MSTTALTLYVLVWPVVVGVVLLVLSRAFVAEWLEARREGRDLI
ncbi:putative transporter small subunit [Nocardioides solisilvae]|nr:putative transporter small subunit [Nocardioides solisilvae]